MQPSFYVLRDDIIQDLSGLDVSVAVSCSCVVRLNMMLIVSNRCDLRRN